MEGNFNIDPTIQYDIVELPSRGIYYKNKKKSLKVGYLTASDENILSSDNIVKSGKIVDELLKSKVLDRDLEVDEIVEEDRQAILIFLRNTAFGSDYKIKDLVDPKTGKKFEVEISLDELNYTDFKLTPNNNDFYEFKMPISGYKIEFIFPSKIILDEIENFKKNWNQPTPCPAVTKLYEFIVKSIDGDMNPITIRNVMNNLPIKDSQDFKKFIEDNKPKIDLKKTVKAPSGEEVQFNIGFGVEFFRPFYGI